MSTLKYIDLFAGCGGLSLGLKQSGWKGLLAIEKNPSAFQTLNYNLLGKDSHFEWLDWVSKTPHDINEIIEKYASELRKVQDVNLIVGGPPCQGFSLAGKRDHTDARNSLIHAYLTFVELVNPRFVFLENVSGFTCAFTKGDINIPYSELVCKKLEELGYKTEKRIINMSDFGVPQNRNRFILFACKNGEPSIFFKKLEQNKANFLKNKGLPNERKISVEEAIGDLLHSNGNVTCPDSPRFQVGLYSEPTTSYQHYIKQNYNNELPDSHRFAKHKPYIVVQNMEIMKQHVAGTRITPKNTLITDFKKRSVVFLDKDVSSPTVTAHPDDFIHYSEPRILTVRELARLQSFPDWFEFKGPYTTGGIRRKSEVPRVTQVGNAIPPLFAEQVGLAIKEIINGDS